MSRLRVTGAMLLVLAIVVVAAAPGAIAPGACNPGVIDYDCNYVYGGATYHCTLWTGNGCVADLISAAE